MRPPPSKSDPLEVEPLFATGLWWAQVVGPPCPPSYRHPQRLHIALWTQAGGTSSRAWVNCWSRLLSRSGWDKIIFKPEGSWPMMSWQSNLMAWNSREKTWDGLKGRSIIFSGTETRIDFKNQTTETCRNRLYNCLTMISYHMKSWFISWIYFDLSKGY